MDEDKNKEPSERLRNIFSEDEEKPGMQPGSQSQIREQSPLAGLPRTKTMMPKTSQGASQISTSQTLQTQATPKTASPFKNFKFGPPFWTITGILSLTINVVLIAAVFILINMLGPFQGTVGNIGTSVIGGLYTNFEKMDRATIQTIIPVDAQVPINISVPVHTTTQIVLAETVEIPNAQVVINTGGLNINSNANVTLPVGTPLLVDLNFDLPIQATVPIHVDVPINIPMANTELHDPFVGLQDVVQPLYCLVDSKATNLNGQAICR